MKPYSFATIIIRFLALYLIIAGLLTGLVPLFFSAVFANAFSSSSATLGAMSVQMNSPFAGIVGLQFAIAAIEIVGGILLYIWSRPFGRLIASGLESLENLVKPCAEPGSSVGSVDRWRSEKI